MAVVNVISSGIINNNINVNTMCTYMTGKT